MKRQYNQAKGMHEHTVLSVPCLLAETLKVYMKMPFLKKPIAKVLSAHWN